MGAGELSALHCSLGGICGVQLLEAPIFLAMLQKGLYGNAHRAAPSTGLQIHRAGVEQQFSSKSVDSPALLQQGCTCEPNS